MARPIKDGLSYFPFGTDFFRLRSVRALRGHFGTDGIAAYIYILCEIYDSKGYYTVIDDDFLDAAVCDLGIKINALQQIIEFLVDRSLLTRILIGPDKFYTSADIQDNYQMARRGSKRCVEVDAEIWLLKNSDTLPFIKVRSPEYNSEKNSDDLSSDGSFSEKNSSDSGVFPTNNSQSRVDKIRVDNSRVEVEADKSTAATAQTKIISALTSVGYRNTQALRDAAAQWLRVHSEDVILYAIAEADSCGNVSRKYIGAILNRYEREKLVSVEEIRADAERHSRRGKGFSDKDSSVYQSGGTDYSDLERRMNAKYSGDWTD